MKERPLQQIIHRFFTCSNIYENISKLFLRIFQLDMVQSKKNKHGMCGNALISIEEWMIFR